MTFASVLIAGREDGVAETEARRLVMYANFDQAENFETLLASEFGRIPQVDRGPGREGFDAGFKVVNALVSDLALDMAVLDLDDLA